MMMYSDAKYAILIYFERDVFEHKELIKLLTILHQ